VKDITIYGAVGFGRKIACLLNQINEITNKLVDFPNIIASNINVIDKEAFTIEKGNLIFLGCRLTSVLIISDINLFNGTISLGHDVKVGGYNVLQPDTWNYNI